MSVNTHINTNNDDNSTTLHTKDKEKADGQMNGALLLVYGCCAVNHANYLTINHTGVPTRSQEKETLVRFKSKVVKRKRDLGCDVDLV